MHDDPGNFVLFQRTKSAGQSWHAPSNHTTMRICLLMHTNLSHFQIIASTSIIFHGSSTFYGIINFSTSCPLELISLGRRDDLLSHAPAACKYAMLGFLVALFLRKNRACCQYCHGCLAHTSSFHPRPSLLSRAPLMSKNKNEADTDVEGWFRQHRIPYTSDTADKFSSFGTRTTMIWTKMMMTIWVMLQASASPKMTIRTRTETRVIWTMRTKRIRWRREWLISLVNVY